MKRLPLLLALLLCLAACGRAPLFQPQARPGAEIATRDKSLPPETAAPPGEPADPALTSGTGPIDHTVGTTLTPLRRWYGAYTDHLIPSPDYGPLYPFVGQNWEFSEYDPYTFGLMTGDGTVVVDSVYINACPLAYQDTELPVLGLLAVPEGWDGAMVMDDVEPYLPSRVTAAARDGSWVLEDWYDDLSTVSETEFLLSTEDGQYSLFDLQGNCLNRFTLDPELYCYRWRDGLCIAQERAWGEEGGAFFLVDARAGTAVPLPGTTFAADNPDDLVPFRDENGLWGCIDMRAGGRWAIAPTFADMGFFRDGYAVVSLGEEESGIIDETGKILMTLPHERRGLYLKVYEVEGTRYLLVEFVKVYDAFNGYQAYYIYDENGTLLEALPEGTTILSHGETDPPLLLLPDGRCRWLGEAEEFTLPPGSRSPGMDVHGQLNVTVGDEVLYLDRRGQVVAYPAEPGNRLTDGDTGRRFYLSDPLEGRSTLYDQEGNPLAELENDWASWYILCRGGLIQCRKGETAIVYDLEGNVLLRYPMRPFGWPPRIYDESD